MRAVLKILAILALVLGGAAPAVAQYVVPGPSTVLGTANEVTVTCTGGLCTVSLPSAITLTGKTLTGGTFSAPVFSGSITGTYTLAGTPTITSPAISGPTISGTVAGTPTWASAQTFPGLTLGGTISMGTNVLGFTGAGTSAAPLVSLVGTDGSVNGLYRTADGTLSFTTGVGGGHRMSLTTSALNMLVDVRSNSDNGVDVGGTSNRFRTVYSGTSFIGPLYRSDSAKVLVQGTGTGATQLAATQTTAPTCSASCGTSPSVAGTDTFMTVTMGASGVPASGFVVTFNGTWAAAPSCVGVPALAGMAVGKIPIVIATTTTTLTVTTNGVAPATSDKYHFHCGGLQ